MTQQQALALVTELHAYYPMAKKPDGTVLALWAQELGGFDYHPARDACLDLCRRDASGRMPSVFEFRAKIVSDGQRMQGLLKLPEPMPSPEEIARNKRRLREIVTGLQERPRAGA